MRRRAVPRVRRGRGLQAGHLAVPVDDAGAGTGDGHARRRRRAGGWRRASARRCGRSGAPRSSATAGVHRRRRDPRRSTATYRNTIAPPTCSAFTCRSWRARAIRRATASRWATSSSPSRRARRRAPGRRLVAELERLAIHGLCHLFGHDHKNAPRRSDVRAGAPAAAPEDLIASGVGGLCPPEPIAGGFGHPPRGPIRTACRSSRGTRTTSR